MPTGSQWPQSRAKTKPGLLGQVAVPDHQELGPHQVAPEHGEAEAQLAEVVALLGRDEIGDAQVRGAVDRHQGEQHVRAQERAHEEERAEQVGEPVGLQRHDAVERHQREHDRVDHGVRRREPRDPVLLPGLRLGGARVAAGQPVVQLAAAGGRRGADGQQVGHHVGQDEPPADARSSSAEADGQAGEHERVREPDGLAVLQLGQGRGHGPVDRRIAEREDEQKRRPARSAGTPPTPRRIG